MVAEVSGFKTYEFWTQGPDDGPGQWSVKLNQEDYSHGVGLPVIELTPGTDYRNKFAISAIDNAGNRTAKVAFTMEETQTLSSTPEDDPMSSFYTDKIDAVAAKIMAAGAGPGATIAVTSPYGFYYKSYGTGTSKDYHYLLASQTKVPAAVTILQAVDQGLLSLDDTLDQYITGVTNGAQITIEHLLSHRSGVCDPQISNANLGVQFTLNPQIAMTVDQYIAGIKSGPPMFLPGEDYHYTNSNWFFLGKIREAVDPTNRPMDQILLEDVYEPCGMANSYLKLDSGVPKSPYAVAYDNDPIQNTIIGFLWSLTFGLLGPAPVIKRNVSAQNPSLIWVAGAQVAMINDMVKFYEAVRDNDLLSPDLWALWMEKAWVHPMTAWGLKKQGPTEYGYGWGLYNIGLWRGHGGSWLGSDTGTMFHTETGTIISVYNNFQWPTAPSMTAWWYEIAEILHPGSTTAKVTRLQPTNAQIMIDTGTPDVKENIIGMVVPSPKNIIISGAAPALGLPVMPTGGEISITGGQPPSFVDFDETEPVTNANVPAGAAGAYFTANGAGAAGQNGVGAHSAAGRGGGGSGARINRIWIPRASMGSTYSTAKGIGGLTANADGGDTYFRSASVDLTAGGGKGSVGGVAGGLGGSVVAAGISGVTSFSGKNGGTGTGQTGNPGASETTNEVAGGGGAGGTGNGGAGGAGGNSPYATGGGAGYGNTNGNGGNGQPGGNASTGHKAGAGGGGGGLGLVYFGVGVGGKGGNGGLLGGGGGSGGNGNDNGGIGGGFGKGGDGGFLLEWKGTAP